MRGGSSSWNDVGYRMSPLGFIECLQAVQGVGESSRPLLAVGYGKDQQEKIRKFDACLSSDGPGSNKAGACLLPGLDGINHSTRIALYTGHSHRQGSTRLDNPVVMGVCRSRQSYRPHRRDHSLPRGVAAR